VIVAEETEAQPTVSGKAHAIAALAVVVRERANDADGPASTAEREVSRRAIPLRAVYGDEFADRAGIGASEEKSPDFLWMSSEQLAEEALDAAGKGKRAVVPGALNLAGSTPLYGRKRCRRRPIRDCGWVDRVPAVPLLQRRRGSILDPGGPQCQDRRCSDPGQPAT